MPIRAAVMPAPNVPIEVRRIDDPALQRGSVLLETVASEVCGTDVHLHHGRLSGVPYPIIPGHVSVGRVVEAVNVTQDGLGEPLTTGDLATFYDVHETCHECYHCTIARQPNRCPQRRVYGITYSADDGPMGGWSECIHLLPGVRTLRIPDGLSPDKVIGGGCGLFTGFAAVERSSLAMGDSVLVQGAGPVGLSAGAFAALRGAGLVIMIGAPEARLSLARDLGIDETIPLEAGLRERADRIATLTQGRGVDVIIEASGNPQAVGEALDLLRDGGTYVVAGHYTDTGSVEINPHVQVNRRHADIRGQWGTDFHHVARALRTLARHADKLPFERVIGARYGLDEANQALDDVASLHVTKAIIVP